MFDALWFRLLDAAERIRREERGDSLVNWVVLAVGLAFGPAMPQPEAVSHLVHDGAGLKVIAADRQASQVVETTERDQRVAAQHIADP